MALTTVFPSFWFERGDACPFNASHDFNLQSAKHESSCFTCRTDPDEGTLHEVFHPGLHFLLSTFSILKML